MSTKLLLKNKLKFSKGLKILNKPILVYLNNNFSSFSVLKKIKVNKITIANMFDNILFFKFPLQVVAFSNLEDFTIFLLNIPVSKIVIQYYNLLVYLPFGILIGLYFFQIFNLYLGFLKLFSIFFQSFFSEKALKVI
jgi:hypothetical protein